MARDHETTCAEDRSRLRIACAACRPPKRRWAVRRTAVRRPVGRASGQESDRKANTLTDTRHERIVSSSSRADRRCFPDAFHRVNPIPPSLCIPGTIAAILALAMAPLEVPRRRSRMHEMSHRTRRGSRRTTTAVRLRMVHLSCAEQVNGAKPGPITNFSQKKRIYDTYCTLPLSYHGGRGGDGVRLKTTVGMAILLAGAGVGAYLGSYHRASQRDGTPMGPALRAVEQRVESLVQRVTGTRRPVDKTFSGTANAGSEPPVSPPPPVTTDNAPPPTPTVIDGISMRYNPYEPSDGPYPKLTAQERVWIDASIDQQLIYLLDGRRVLYTMIMSSGIDTAPDTSTPLGVYHIQAERGTWFFAQQYDLGARYWVSWLHHGIFLFHSVPMNIHEQLVAKIAAKLGHPASVGCFQLTIPDAKWLYENIPYKTTVVVEQAPVALQGGRIYKPSPTQRAAITASEAAGAGAAIQSSPQGEPAQGGVRTPSSSVSVHAPSGAQVSNA